MTSLYGLHPLTPNSRDSHTPSKPAAMDFTERLFVMAAVTGAIVAASGVLLLLFG